jgi:heptosyltransferase-2
LAAPPASNPPAEQRRILVMAPSWVGDVVMATPALRALRHRFPDAYLAVLARRTGADVLEHNPHVNRTIVADRRGRGPETRGVRGLIRLLRAERFDLAVLMPNSFRVALWAWCARAMRRVGYRGQWRSALLTDRLPQPRENGRVVPINMVDRYLDLCRAVGCAELSKEEELFASEEDAARAERVLRSLGIAPDDRFAVLIPGASFGPSKLWGSGRFAAVADGLAERFGLRVLAHVGPGEEDIGEALGAAAETEPAVPAPGTIDLRTLKAVVRRSVLVVANDTGPRHYAVAYGVPNVVILGPTSRRYIDVNLERTELLQADVECGPCQRKVCPRDHRCMQRITPEMVLAAAGSLLASH